MSQNLLEGIYQVKNNRGRTTVRRLEDTDSLSLLLQDIGARNSDVLLSNAVLFVEGPADRAALNAWSRTVGLPLEDHNVTVLTGIRQGAGVGV
jgi:predicted ATP-dependent endonuclease of OLD family